VQQNATRTLDCNVMQLEHEEEKTKEGGGWNEATVFFSRGAMFAKICVGNARTKQDVDRNGFRSVGEAGEVFRGPAFLWSGSKIPPRTRHAT